MTNTIANATLASVSETNRSRIDLADRDGFGVAHHGQYAQSCGVRQRLQAVRVGDCRGVVAAGRRLRLRRVGSLCHVRSFRAS